jgi:hypothetical protein
MSRIFPKQTVEVVLKKGNKITAPFICVLQDIRKYTHIKHHSDSSGSQKRFHGIKIITQEINPSYQAMV